MKTVKIPKGKELVVIGDIHEQEWHFDQMIERAEIGTKRIGVSAGDIFDRGEGKHVAESILRKIQKGVEEGWFYFVRGNHEMKYINKAGMVGSKVTMTPELRFCKLSPLALSFMFHNQNRITVLHGGVTPKHNWGNLDSSEDIMYIRYLDDDGEIVPTEKSYINGKKVWHTVRPAKSWHEYYDGRFGFIVAGHDPQDNGRPKYYKHSCNVDTKCYETGVLCGQVISDGIPKEVILVEK